MGADGAAPEETTLEPETLREPGPDEINATMGELEEPVTEYW
jgi:hypothetical protein